jgi:hypothetical protein
VDADDLTLPCSCSYLHHAVRFTFHPWGPHDKAGEFEAYVEVSLDFEHSLWRRLRVALRYFFRRTCGYGDVSEILIRDQDLPKLRAWVERASHDACKRRLASTSGAQ